jgi:predicted ATPase
MIEATRYAIRAAEACAVRSATLEADRMLKRAEGCLASAGSAPEIDELTLQLLAARGPVAISLFGKGSPEARSVYERGVELCRDRGIQDRERWFPLYWGWWFTASDFATQQTRAEILVSDLERAADPETRLQALHCAWATSFHSGKHAECLEWVEQGLLLYNPERARVSRVRYGGHDAKVCGLGERALSLWFIGHDEASTESCRAAIRWAEEINHLGSLVHALTYAIGLHRYRNEPDVVTALARRLQELAVAHALPGAMTRSKMYEAWSSTATSPSAEALLEFRAGLQMQREIGTEENLSVSRDMESEILVRVGQYDEARTILNDTIESSLRAGQLFWLSELYRRRGLLSEAIGANRDASLQDLKQAIALAESQGAISLARRARADLERLSPSSPPEG